MRRSRLVLLACFLLVAACGDDDEAGGGGGGGGGGDSAAAADDPYVEAATEAIQSDPEFPLDDDEASCFARQLVGIIGSDTLEEAGVEPEDFAAEDGPDLGELGIELTEEQNRAIAGSFEECGISITELIIAGIAAEGDAPEGLAECLEENLDEDAFSEVFAAGFAGDESEAASEEFLAMIFALAETCPGLLEAGG